MESCTKSAVDEIVECMIRTLKWSDISPYYVFTARLVLCQMVSECKQQENRTAPVDVAYGYETNWTRSVRVGMAGLQKPDYVRLGICIDLQATSV